MTDIEVLDREMRCVRRKAMVNCSNCGSCDLLTDDERILTAYANAIAALRSQQEAEKIEPLTLEELREMGGEPYWHVGLRDESPPPHWTILPDNIAKHLQDYFYGEYWLAYRRPPEKGVCGNG